MYPRWKFITLPTAQNDAQQEETVVGADTEEELLESNGVLEFQGLAIKDRCGLLIDGLTDAQNGWSEVCDVLIIGLVNSLQENLSSIIKLGLFVMETTSNYLLASGTFGEESEGVGILLEEELVDHKTDFKRELHERKGGVLKRLLGLGRRLGLGRALRLGPTGLRMTRSTMVVVLQLGADIT